MKAAMLLDYGSAENLRIVDVPTPKAGPGEVLVKVEYAGLRYSDISRRQGISGHGFPTPFITGAEAAGTVAEVGEGVAGYKAGDRVTAQPAIGANAEYVAVTPDRLALIPDRVPLETSLVYRVNLIAAYLAAIEWAKVQDGEIVVVHAAAGGVGSLIVQILKRRLKDVTVIGLGGSDEKVAAIRANGADHAINYKAEDHVAKVGEIAGVKGSFTPAEAAKGVHVVLNGVGGDTIASDRAMIRKHGRWVLFGTPGGSRPIDLFDNVYDSITVMPFSMLTFTGTPAMKRAYQFLDQWLETEDLTGPVIHPLEDIAAVHAAMEKGQTQGKIVFRI